MDTAVASAAAIVAKAKPITKSSMTAAADGERDPEPERDDLALELHARRARAPAARSSSRAPRPLSPRRRDREPGGRQSLGCAWPLQSIHFASTMPAASAAPTTSQGSARRPLSSSASAARRAEGRRGDVAWPRLQVRRRLALGARLDQARLHLANQVGVLGERLGELRLQAAFARQLISELLELVRCALDFWSAVISWWAVPRP